MPPEQTGVAGALRSVARVVRQMSLWAGIGVIITFTLGYGGVRYLTLDSEVRQALAVQAQIVEGFIATHPDSWDISGDRLEAVIEKYVPAGMVYRVASADGATVAGSSEAQATLSLARQQPLYAFGTVVGSISLSASYADQLGAGLGVLLLALALAAVIWGPMKAQPLLALARAERELVDREVQLRNAYQAAEAANRAKSEFLASMSHELRTPLNAVLGYAQLFCADPALSGENREFAGEIERAGNHLLSLINDVLDLARIEAGKIDLAMAPVPVYSLVTDCIKLTEATAQRFGVVVSSRLAAPNDGSDGDAVMADPTRLRQVLINFISNGIKYGKLGGEVVIALGHASAGCVRLTVRDNGRGISKDKQERLFTAFDRLGAEGGSIEGTGIGLVIAKRIVDAMGGTIGFSSREGEGSTFWVELKRAT